MASRGRVPVARLAAQSRAHGFGSAAFRSCFGDIPPVPDIEALRAVSQKELKSFDPQTWYKEPMVSIIDGKSVAGGTDQDTTDAWGKVNGRQVYADEKGEALIQEHIQKLTAAGGKAPAGDYRAACRKIEDRFLDETGELAAKLVVNQAVDFFKQNSYEEMSEWVQACTVERRLVDRLVDEENEGKLHIRREPAFVGCVSNFSNFLDLSRKVFRNIEAGVPVVVLSRDSIGQHMFRWFELLVAEMQKEGLPLSLVTFVTLSIPAKQRMLKKTPESPFYFTGSRAVAKAIREVCPHLMAGMVGPNTMVAGKLTPEVAAAVRHSSVIENAGQCTHVRHLAVPGVTKEQIASIYDGLTETKDAAEAFSRWGQPQRLYAGHLTTAKPGKIEDGYDLHPEGTPVAYRLSSELPPDDLDEKWRQVFLDVTTAPRTDDFVDKLSDWLVKTGPITLAVNDDDPTLAVKFFEKSSLTVYNIGTSTKPALNVSALPQESEAFGEFPDRSQMTKYTKFPVIVPSPTPAYHAHYTAQYLQKKAGAEKLTGDLGVLQDSVGSTEAKGYLRELYDFLVEATGPRDNTDKPHKRTAVWGWQRPPLNGMVSIIRADASTTPEAFAAALLPFLATNAKDCVEVSVDPANKAVRAVAEKLSAPLKIETTEGLEGRNAVRERPVYNLITPEYDAGLTGPLAAQFLTLFFPLGHCKSMVQNDTAFIERFKASPKWLSVV